MAIGLGDIYEKLKELITITDKVRENTDRIVKLEEKVDTLHQDMVEMQANILKIQLAEHIAACEKAKA